MGALLVFIIIISYLVSAYMSWYYVNKAYSKGGRYHGDKVDVNDIVFSFLPIANMFYWSISWLLYPPIERKRTKIDWNKFFRIK